MERIKELIAAGELEAAKRLIIDRETKLSEEPSPHVRCLLKKQIMEMKSLYLSKMEKNLNSVKERDGINVDICSQPFLGSDRKRIISSLRSVKVDGMRCSEARIEDCFEIATGVIDSENSILIRNVRDSEIKCRASQVRLIDCHCISLTLFTRTGVYLQNSGDIAIKPLSSEPENLYKTVFDFTDPSGKNYRILDHSDVNK